MVFAPTLTASELRRAEYHLFRRAQVELFLPKSSNFKLIIKSKLLPLSPVIGRDGLLRVGGRLSQSNLSMSQIHPIILSSTSAIVTLLFQYNHVSLGHCGPTLLLASTGTRLHVIGARLLARSVCRQCVTCRKISAKADSQMMGQLPAQRVTPSHPFQITGVDYAGPFIVKKGYTRKPTLIKTYLALFVCFSSKAVHIEVIEDLSWQDSVDSSLDEGTPVKFTQTVGLLEQRMTSVYFTDSSKHPRPSRRTFSPTGSSGSASQKYLHTLAVSGRLL